MASTSTFYAGADYGLEPDADPGGNYLGMGTKYPASQFAFTTDSRSANQLSEVSKKLSTGAKTIEVQGVTPNILESVPNQHLDELNRLRKLVGADLTFHGPLVEPSGITKQGWRDTMRQEAERQMWSAVERSHKLDPKGNVVVTFHSSNGLPSTDHTVMDDKSGKPKLMEKWLVDERSGNFDRIGPAPPDYFKGQHADEKIEDTLRKRNESSWFRTLQSVNFNVNTGSRIIQSILKGEGQAQKEDMMKHPWQQMYKDYLKGDTKRLETLKSKSPELAKVYERNMTELAHGDIYLRDAYNNFQELFNQAYDNALKGKNEKDLNRLKEFRARLAPKLKELEDPNRIQEFSKELLQGVNLLRSVESPQTLKSMTDFAIDKSGETFANLALKSYKNFKENAPIISIENPPAGGGLSRADELKRLTEDARKKFIKKAQEQLHLPKSEAKKQAEKLIGVTWDVGHINMIRKFGYEGKDVVKETKTIAPFVKHVHLSDNFGMEHTELPMGMGNVPTKKMMDLVDKYNKQAKKVVETGGPWFQFFQRTPVRETFEAFGTPLYGAGPTPYWNQMSGTTGGYSVGFGNVLPDVNFQTYGAGFSTLPPELGGQMGGRNRMGGAPTE